MDDVLKQRLIGAAVLLAAALLLSVLIPDPGTPPPLEPGQQRVTVNLQESTVAITDVQPSEEAPAADSVPAAAEPQPLESPPAIEESLAAATGPVVEPDPVAPPVAPAPAPQTVPQKASGPALKLDSALSKPPQTAHPAVPPQPAAPAAKPVATAEKPWYVQAGSFGEIANARQLLDKLKPAGFPVLISPADTASGTRYRVRLGPYPDRAQAEDARIKLAGQGVSGTAVTQE